jgi:hypothetical protein
MAINGVNGSLLQLLLSQDKNIQDFLATIKPGDTLRGRVLEILQGENKAIINFRGFNIISELPTDMLINPGDIINVQVSKVNDQVFMKLVPPNLDLGRGAEMPDSRTITVPQIISMLNNIKVPVNEQNIFIAQKLADYHLAVTAENIVEVNSALGRYMDNKGIDVRAFNVQTPQAAKEIVLENMLKLNTQLNQVISAEDDAAHLAQSITALNANEKINNIINTIAAVIQGSSEISITEKNGIVTLTINNPPPNLVKNMAISALRDGSVTTAEAEDLINNANLLQPASTGSGSVVINRAAGNSLEIQFNNLSEMVKTAAASGDTGRAALMQQSNNMLNSFNDKLLGLNPAGRTMAAVIAKPDLMNVLNADFKPILQALRENTSLLLKSVTSPGGINMEQNIKDIASQISKINNSVTALNNSFEVAVDKSAALAQEISVYKSQLNSVYGQVKNIVNNLKLASNPEELNVAPKEFLSFQAVVKQFAQGLENIPVLNASAPVNEAKYLSIPVQVNPVIDMESTIESIAFLKSRNISTGNDGFIDIMGKYFKNDMKLNQNMEALTLAFDRFDAVKNTASPDRLTNAFVNRINDLTANVRDLMQKISIIPSDSNLKPQIMQDQLLNFIDKSGLNTENKLKEMALQADAAAIQIVTASKETLKAQLITLANEIGSSAASKLNSQQKSELDNVREKATDILTNMNALQFINQKPVSYEALYTQIPVFLNNKFFNGELQVWYRKGSLKENYEKSMPINFVFMLNTSNMGNVKISMTVYKKEVECNVTIDNEKAKQVLMRGKNDFLKSMESVNFNMKNFNIQLEKDGPVDAPAPSDGYVNLGRINMQA